MENTASFLFDDTTPKYFVAHLGKAVGPLTANALYRRMQSGEIGLMHFIWDGTSKDWKRISDDPEFAVLVPQKPSTSSIHKIQERVKKKPAAEGPPATDQEHSYYLFFNDSQYGPFSKPELARVLNSEKIEGTAYVWIPGWSDWRLADEVPELAGAVPEPEVRPALRRVISGRDRRGAPRRPLVARLFVHNNEDVIMAVCRDISVGGMQVLTDKIPGEVGDSVKLNVSPADEKKVAGFVAQGEIVRILEDRRGFSFRFTKISADAKKAIAEYITVPKES